MLSLYPSTICQCRRPGRYVSITDSFGLVVQQQQLQSLIKSAGRQQGKLCCLPLSLSLFLCTRNSRQNWRANWAGLNFDQEEVEVSEDEREPGAMAFTVRSCDAPVSVSTTKSCVLFSGAVIFIHSFLGLFVRSFKSCLKLVFLSLSPSLHLLPKTASAAASQLIEVVCSLLSPYYFYYH